MTRSSHLSRATVLTLIVTAGCLFGGKSAPLDVRYFSPEPTEPRDAAPRTHQGAVRIGDVTSSAHLRYRIVHRTSAVERELHDTWRWTELPEAYVRRSLSRALYVDRALERAPREPTLDVEVLGFEYAERDGRPVGRVELGFELRDHERVIANGTITRERLATGTNIESVVVAIGTAMDTATAAIADRVLASRSK